MKAAPSIANASTASTAPKALPFDVAAEDGPASSGWRLRRCSSALISAGRWTSCTTTSPTGAPFACSTSSTRSRVSAWPSKSTHRCPRRVVAVLDRLVWRHGLPESLRVDNGPEFISEMLGRWAARHSVKLDFIQPGKPTQNAHVESFNGRFRDECLSEDRFPTLARARLEIECWRVDCNTQRPHSALGYLTPKTFADKARQKVPPSAGAAAALVGFAEQAPRQFVACERTDHSMIEVN